MTTMIPAVELENFDVDTPALVDVLERARARARARLREEGSLRREVYVRFLSLHHELARDAMRRLLLCAAHSDLAQTPELRSYLVSLAFQEEPRSTVARIDLELLGSEPPPPCADAQLWWAWFDLVVEQRPFLHLGAFCVVDAVFAEAHSFLHEWVRGVSWLDRSNTRLLWLDRERDRDRHSSLLDQVQRAELGAAQRTDLLEGARMAALLLQRMLAWVVSGYSE